MANQNNINLRSIKVNLEVLDGIIENFRAREQKLAVEIKKLEKGKMDLQEERKKYNKEGNLLSSRVFKRNKLRDMKNKIAKLDKKIATIDENLETKRKWKNIVDQRLTDFRDTRNEKRVGPNFARRNIPVSDRAVPADHAPVSRAEAVSVQRKSSLNDKTQSAVSTSRNSNLLRSSSQVSIQSQQPAR